MLLLFSQDMLIKVEMIGLTSSSELSYQPCQAHSFLSGVRDGHRTYPQFIYPCAEQFEQPVLDLVFIPKDQQTFHQGV